jgi:TRAP-type C4-dicarboxylate transport system permease small subunit
MPVAPALESPSEVAADAIGSPAAIDEEPPFPPRGEPAPIGALRAVDGAIGLVEQVALCGFVLSLIVAGLTSAVAGNVFNTGVGWTAEVIQYSVFWIAMIGAALCAQKARMMAMDVLTRLMTPAQKAAARVVTSTGVIVICWLLVQGSLRRIEGTGSLSEAYNTIPPHLGQLAMPIGAGLIASHYIIHLLIDLRYFAAGSIAPEAPAGPGH